MALFVGERYVSARSAREAVSDDERAAAAQAGRASAIRHVRTWIIPADETCLSLFEAPSAEAVREAGDAANVHYTRICEVLETSGTAAVPSEPSDGVPSEEES